MAEQPTDDSFESLLAARHNAIVQGSKEDDQSTVVPLADQIERAAACMRSLERLRRAGLYDSDASAEPTSMPVADSTGSIQMFGRFQILRALGRGGQGLVYLAFDAALERQVALKIPAPEAVATQELKTRFLREARAAAGMEHPFLVTVYEAGTVGPVCYIASRYCPGPNLAEWLRNRCTPVPPALAARLVAQLAEAVEYMHGRGILHRDLKPANVLLETSESHDPSPKITDFGLAKSCDSPGELTETGNLLGTPQYMAPEQAAGQHGDVGPHTDVYALGIILYELLTGRPPFRGKTKLETLQQVSSMTPVALRSIRPELPRDLETVCLKAIARESGRRYGTAADFADDLHRIMAGEPVRARPVRLPERIWSWCRRNRGVAALLAISAALLVCLLTTAAVFSLVYRAERNYARRQEQIANQQRDRALDENRIASHNLYAANLGLAQRELELGNVERVISLLNIHRPSDGAFDLRGFEWYYLWRLCRRDLVLRGHGHEVNALQFIDATRFASAGSDATVAIWDAESGRKLATLSGHTAPVRSIAVLPDCQSLVTGDEAGSIRLWDIATEFCRQVFEGHENGVSSLAVSPDGRHIASASWDNTVRVWNSDTSREELVLRRKQAKRPGLDLFEAVSWTSNGKTVIAASRYYGLIFWDIETGEQVASLKAHASNFTSLAVSPDGRVLATASEDRTVKLWNLDEMISNREAGIVEYVASDAADGGAEESAFASVLPLLTVNHTSVVAHLDFSPDSRSFATAVADGTVRWWETATGNPIAQFRGHTGAVSGVAFSPDSRTLVSGGRDTTIRLWDTQSGRAKRAASSDLTDRWRQESPTDQAGSLDRFEFFPVGHYVNTLSFSPDNRLLAVGGKKKNGAMESLAVWDVQLGKPLPHIKSEAMVVRTLGFASNGRQLVVDTRIAPGPNGVVAWDLDTGSQRTLFINDTGPVLSLAITPDNRKIYAAGGLIYHHGTVFEFDMLTNQMRRLFQKEGDYMRAIAVSSDARTIAAATGDGEVVVWRDNTDQPRSFCAHEQRVFQIAFAPDGQSFVTASRDATAKIWAADTLKQRGILSGHTQSVTSVAWSPDSKTIATGSADGTIKLWDPVIRQERIRLHGSAGIIWSLAFSPDGSILAAGTESGAVLLFEASTESTSPSP